MSKAKVVQTRISYGKPQELTNIITHASGAALGFVGLVFLMLKTVPQGSILSSVAVFIFGISVVAALTVSALCHLMKPGTRRRAVLRRLDRCTIPLLIFGAYAPVMLIGMTRGTPTDAIWGYVLFAVIAATAILSIVFNGINAEKFKAFGLVTYILMGWACVVRIDRILELCGSGCFWFLLGGGMVYVVGVVINSIKKIPCGHAIWHFFVTAGAALHFVCVYVYLV